MARTAPAPNIPPIPGMCPGVAVLAGSGDGGGAGAGGKKRGKGKKGAGTDDGDEDASGDGENGGEGCGDPVCPITGRVFLEYLDFAFPGPAPLVWKRTYSSRLSARAGDVGHGWTHSFSWTIRVERRRIFVIDDFAREQAFELGRGEVEATNALGWRLSLAGTIPVLRLPGGDELHFGWSRGRERRLTARADANGNTIRVTRTPKGAIEHLLDSAGRPYRVTCDAHGRITFIHVATDPNAQHWMPVASYEYDQHGNLTRFIDAEEYSFSYRYVGHLLAEHRTPGGLSYHYRYENSAPEALCLETWGDYGDAPDPALAVQPKPRPDRGHDARTFKGNNHRRFTYLTSERYSEVVDACGGCVRYFGDAAGRVVKKVDAGGGVTTRLYDESGALIQETLPDETVRHMPRRGRDAQGYASSAGGERHVFPDDSGCIVEFDPSTGLIVRMARDERGNITFVEHPDLSTETYSSDSRGLLVSAVNRLGIGSQFHHDAMGNLVRVDYPDGLFETSEYDYLGRRIAHTDANNRRTEWAWDRRNDVIMKRHADGTEIHVERDWFRKPVRVNDNGAIHRFAWGGIGWLHRYEDPAGRVTEMRYDAEGRLVLVRNPRGQEFTQTYDAAGRCIACVTFEGVAMEAGFDVAGRAIWVRSPLGAETRAYDEMGALIACERPDGTAIAVERDRAARTVSIDNGEVLVLNEYDPAGQIVRDRQGRHETKVLWRGGVILAMVSDVGVPIAHRRGSLGLLAEIHAGDLHVSPNRLVGNDVAMTVFGDSLVLRHRYGPVGELLETALFKVPHARHALEEVARREIGAALRSTRYQYDGHKYLRAEWHADGRTIEYELDAAGQVRRRRRSEGSVQAVEDLRYDAAGSPRVAGATYDEAGRPIALGAETFEYDEAGRLTRREGPEGSYQYEYSAAGDLIRAVNGVSEVTMTYDARGRRLRKVTRRQGEVVRDTHYVWSNNVVLHEHNALDGSSRTYLRMEGTWEPFGHVDVLSGTRRAMLYVTNPIGAVEAAFSEDGELIWEVEYATFGEPTVRVGARDAITARFCNQWDDEDVGLVYNFRRWYEPRLGVFVTPDPLLLEGTPNPRDYAPNPLAFIDPTGLLGPGSNRPGVPGNQDGRGGSGPHSRAPSASGGHAPRPGPPSASDLSGQGTYLLTPGHYATEGTHNSVGQFVPGYANVPPGFDPMAQRGFPAEVQQQVDNAGFTHGCHSCGTTDPGPSGHFTPDHQPPVYQQKAARAAGNPIPASSVRYYPHCGNCSRNQADAANRHSRNATAANAMGQQTAANNAAFQHSRNAANQSATERDAISDHIFGGSSWNRPPAHNPTPVNAGDNRWLGGQSYDRWR